MLRCLCVSRPPQGAVQPDPLAGTPVAAEGAEEAGSVPLAPVAEHYRAGLALRRRLALLARLPGETVELLRDYFGPAGARFSATLALTSG